MESEVRDLRLRTGITVPCLVQGDTDAKPVLLLHAWGESRGSFDRLIPLLTGFRVYAPDLRGQGEADKPEDGYSLAEQADGFPCFTRFPRGSPGPRARRPQDARPWKPILNGLCEATPPTESGTIHAPTLILWGAQDNLLPRGDQETLAARIPGAVLKVYPDVAHMILWECPERVAEDAAPFLTSCA